MRIKDRIKSKSFWAGLIGSVFLMLSAFGVEVADQTVGAVINAVCSMFVVLGIISSPAQAPSADTPTDILDAAENAADAVTSNPEQDVM